MIKSVHNIGREYGHEKDAHADFFSNTLLKLVQVTKDLMYLGNNVISKSYEI